jgi:hypothetical protein
MLPPTPTLAPPAQLAAAMAYPGWSMPITVEQAEAVIAEMEERPGEFEGLRVIVVEKQEARR